MKKTFVSLACAAALLPGVASATQYYDTDVMDFVASSSSYTVKFSWADVFGTKEIGGGYHTFETDGRYSIMLTNLGTSEIVASFSNIADGITGDVFGVLNGSFLKTFNGLQAGQSYGVSIIGKWFAPANEIGTIAQAGSVMAAAVPEPETYAMMLAGLGLVGTMVRRRRSRN